MLLFNKKKSVFYLKRATFVLNIETKILSLPLMFPDGLNCFLYLEEDVDQTLANRGVVNFDQRTLDCACVRMVEKQ